MSGCQISRHSSESAAIIKQIVAVSLLFIIAGALPACTHPERLQEPLQKFLTAANQTAVATKPYILDLNRTERRYRFYEASVDPQKDLNNEIWEPLFTPEGIQVRLEMFDVIDRYIDRLGDVVNSDAGERLATNTEALGGELKTLGNRLQRSGDSTLSGYSEPLAQLVAAVGQMWIDAERERVLRIAVVDAAPQVRIILANLGEEVRRAYDDRLDNLNIRIADLARTYNERRVARAGMRAFNDDERRRRLEEIEGLVNERETLSANPPHDLFVAMQAAHERLVAAAQNRNPQTYSDFVASVDLFSRRAEQVVSALHRFNN